MHTCSNICGRLTGIQEHVVRARCINGRLLCRDHNESDRTSDRGLGRPPVHALELSSPIATYSFPSWTCDMCYKNFFRSTAGFEAMHHCTFGCSYDLCSSCALGLERKKTLRPRPKRRRQPG